MSDLFLMRLVSGKSILLRLQLQEQLPVGLLPLILQWNSQSGQALLLLPYCS